jgi:hypothetical protein
MLAKPLQTENVGGPGRRGGSMSRVASWAIALIWASLLACRTAASPPPPAPPPPPPPPCAVVTGPTVTITVDALARVDMPCVEIKRGMTDVVWAGTADVKRLLIAFKQGPPGMPDDPVCADSTCNFEKAKHMTKRGDFQYSVIVIRQNGTPATVDPRLIIQP